MSGPQDIGFDLDVRLARSGDEIRAAQELRYKVFFENMGATPSAEVARTRRDTDRFDEFCDHLLVVDRSVGGPVPRIVGTYRLLKASVAADCGYYSESEFDLTALKTYPGEILELGRTCVDPAFRNKAVLQLLWKGISGYLHDNGIALMFGCASFPGTDLGSMATALSYLARHHVAPSQWRPVARSERYVDMRRISEEALDPRQALREMPPLIKGYLRVGAVVGDGAVIDDEFNTVDVCLLVETGVVPEKYRRHATDGRDLRPAPDVTEPAHDAVA